MAGRGMAVALVAGSAIAAGCLREPRFQGEVRDAAIDTPDGGALCPPGADNVVGVTMQGEGARICAPRYRVELSALGAHFPSELEVDGLELMGTGLQCNDERGTGVALYPSLIVNGEAASQGTGTLAIDLGSETDAIVKIGLDWSASYMCDDGVGPLERTLGNRTTFTFFPDGQISRYDRFRHPTTSSAGACSTCRPETGADPFYLTSFMTLRAEAGVTTISGADGNEGTLTTQGMSIDATADACASTGMRQVAFGWLGANEQTSTGTRVRASRLPTATEPGAYAFTFDQLAAQSMITSATADTELRTVMLVGGPDTTCTQLLPRLTPILNSQPLRLVRPGPGGADIGVVRNLDGIYGGEQIDGTVAFDVAGVPEDPFTLSIPAGGSAIAGGFAVWVDLAAFYKDVTVTRNRSPSTFTYRLQRVPGRVSQIVLWFPEGMELGDEITVDPVP